MKNESLIINLIQQDLKHNQLILTLDKIGLDGTETHFLNLMDTIAELMKVNDSIQDEWSDLYTICMNRVIYFEIANNDNALKSLAEVSYNQLKAVVERKLKT